MDRVKILNGRIISPMGIIEDGCVVIENGKIAGVHKQDIANIDAQVIDAEGRYISPGFIDIHVHGGGGYDFMDGTKGAFLGAAKLHASHGTTAMIPTTLACSLSELAETFDAYEGANKQNVLGSEFVGLHLEGPYFNEKYSGAQNAKYIKAPHRDEYLSVLKMSDSIVRWSAAPELDGSFEFAQTIKNRGILPCIAHSDALYETVLDAYSYGFTHATHFYNCMSTVQRINEIRCAGVVESVYLIDEMTTEVIADGIHLPASLLKLVYKIKGVDKLALVTDSMRGAGMPEGESILGNSQSGQRVMVEDGAVRMLDRKTLAGSVATADRVVRTMRDLVQIKTEEAVKMMTKTPAAIMGIKNKGSIEQHMDADIVIFDDDINISRTIIGGKTVYSN